MTDIVYIPEMNPAVCVSGLMKTKVIDLQECLDSFKKAFPYPFFLSTWKDTPHPEIEGLHTFEEPETVPPIWHLNPETNRLEEGEEALKYNPNLPPLGPLWSSKQLVGHAHLEKLVPKEYNHIIRIRWDILVHQGVDWVRYVEDSWKYNTVMGFCGFRFTRNHDNKPLRVYYGHHRPEIGHGLNDHLIIYPRHFFDPDRVIREYPQQKIRTGERGWWQYLIESHYDQVDHLHDPCINYLGGVTLERHL